MSNLKSLSIVASTRPRNDPILIRREKLRDRLEEQKKLLEDPTFVRTVQRWTKVDGQKVLAAKQIRVAPWWWTDASGQLLLSVKARGKAIEFEKGKAAIAVPSRQELPRVIDTLISAVGAGELDGQLALVSKEPVMKKARKLA